MVQTNQQRPQTYSCFLEVFVSTPPCAHVGFVGQRKEIALLDLEESSNSEFGSVDLRYIDCETSCALYMTTIKYMHPFWGIGNVL